MKKLLPLLSCLLLFGCGEKKEPISENPDSKMSVGSIGKSKPASKEELESEAVEKPQIESQDMSGSKGLPALPATVTAEFIMDLWSKPHEEGNFIEELKDYKPGNWRFIRNIGPRKGELVERFDGSFKLKWVEKRFVVQKVHNENGGQYSVITYDYNTDSYRWWELMPDGSLNEMSGSRYWRDLVEWKSVNTRDDAAQFSLRETVRSSGAYKAIFEVKQGGNLVAYAKDEGIWVGELNSPVQDDVSPNGKTFGKFTLLDEVMTDGGDRSLAKKNAEDTLKNHPEIDAMIGLWSYNAPQCIKALKDANKLGEVKVFSFDEDAETLDAIKDGHCEGTIVQDPYLFGYDAIRYLKDIVVDDKMPELNEGKNVPVPIRTIAKDNVDEFRKTVDDRLEAGEAAKGAEVPANAPKFAFITNVADPFWSHAEAGCYVAAKDFGVAVNFQMNSAGDIAGQKKIVENILNKGDCKGIAISVLNPENQIEMINKVAEQVPVVAVDSDAPDSTRLFFLGTDNYRTGRGLGKLIKKSMPEGGNIMLYVGKIDQLNSIQRRDGLLDELSGRISNEN